MIAEVRRAMDRELASCFLGLAALLLLARLVVGCVPVEVKQGAAKSAYETEEDHCVDDYSTKDEIDACRRYVRARWGKAPVVWPLADAGIRDAGGDQ